MDPSAGPDAHPAALEALVGAVGDEERRLLVPAIATLRTWLQRLTEWNRRIDLTAARTAAELVDLMVKDALVLATQFASGASVVDAGTGAGAPGLALAFLRPDLSVNLVEPLGKRVTFLRAVIGETGRTDIFVHPSRIEKVQGTFDGAVSRATLAPTAWLAESVRLVRPGGEAWVLLAREDPPGPPNGLSHGRGIEYAWPLTGRVRCAVAYRRVADP
jgi:16S rRNA (guanine527-N7)-methyltransferase